MKKKPVYSTDNKKPASPMSQVDVDTERDLDEQIHSRESDIGSDDHNADPDDMVHKPKSGQQRPLIAEEHSNDPDDLVHDDGDDDEQYE